MPPFALLFLDVDGTLIPFGAERPYALHEPPHPLPGTVTHPLLARIDPALGTRLARLAELGCEPVWATTWMNDANTAVAPWLGLPALRVVDWPEEGEEPRFGPRGLHWKTRPLAACAAGRPFLWVDDEITDADRAWVAGHHPAPALLHRVDHRYGLTDRDFAVLEEWITAGGGPGVR
ncbi:HAD domain-containing protein [Streptomyces sp. AS02]|uniref:HAD domain-containing protein n=1 Tax=Streptomyces sp. AS02 TaxID=2938946 RepID=UPI0020209E1C|nr:HAD domain-containing protein [Streptomyces sp. AS02]MCL8014988.1 HAD domain-containing protein [Streptomyces sp. AS02]